MVQETVEADTLSNLLEKNLESDRIDLFQIDVEGYDFEVIKSLDFGKYRPSIIKYEHVNLSILDQNLAKIHLKAYGYFLFKEGGDTIAVRLDIISL
jgi:hypothetical protein